MTVGEMPSHGGDIYVYKGGGTQMGWLTSSGSELHIVYGPTPVYGNDKYHNNVQPSTAIYRFKRIA